MTSSFDYPDVACFESSLVEISDLLPIGACFLGPNLEVLSWNRTLVDWTGISKAEALRMKLCDRFPNLLSPRYYSRLMQVFRDGTTAVYSAALHKHFIPCPAGHGWTKQLMVQQTHVRLFSSTPPCALATIQDVTSQYVQLNELRQERSQLVSIKHKLEHTLDELQFEIAERRSIEVALRKAKEAAEAANRAKSEFLANMSHEIRTPMTSILGYTDLLLSSDAHALSAAQREEFLHTIQRNGRHLLEIVNDILDLSKIESGRFDLEYVACSPRQLLREIKSLMQVRADEKRLTLLAQFETEVPETIPTDSTRLRQILINLVGNAIKFTETGSVRLLCRYLDSETIPHVEFEVVDTGIGMSEKQVSQLFQPFCQADSSTTRRFGGTGLGLVICRRLSQMMGGDICIDSQPGRGTQVRVSLPIDRCCIPRTRQAKGITQSPETSAGTATSPRSLEGVQVLLAEDGKDNQRLIGLVLRKAGAEVTIVENGVQAVEQVLRAGTPDLERSTIPTFDVILMDMQMPELDGYEATRRLRQANCDWPIIALTAHAMAADREKCLAAGCTDYTTKPIDRETLIGLVGKYAPRSTSSVSG